MPDDKFFRLECLKLAVECREARHSADDVIALAEKFTAYVQGASHPQEARE